ncbi:class I SAM-dependent methyltransferase [Desulfobacula toluolica]|uniref:Putative methyltransferase n=1 Tax=Desulfobacula toluolica (strain DSM 7467 / Tol2) TaxID=651182 RepID=K0NGU8_DESTT|nr:class I SAM-dependent methyltransferase [Desulfobacula toluolica]CCK78222.1 putative methyltransferase [Desulfobacula toluolica Tol2]
MIYETKKNGRHTSGHRGQGPSSFWMQSHEPLFDALGISPGQHILDLGCGAGDYTLEAARRTGTVGCITALDYWPPIVDALEKAAGAAGLPQVRVLKADITNPPLPVRNNAIDLCMVFTVLHIFDLSRYKEAIFGEMARVIRPGGCLAVLECKKEEWSFGPPVHMRLAPEEIETFIRGWGFKKRDYRDFGYNYLLSFTLDA